MTMPTRDFPRLSLLSGVSLMDTPREPAFDRLTALAARLLKAPIVLMTLIDEDRQFFKSAYGLPEPIATQRQTPLSHSICQYVIRSGQPLILEDARKNPLTQSNGAVTELGTVAYAGVPLTAGDGMTLGSFCAIDYLARAWTEEEIATLHDLAASVLTEIRLKESEQHLYQIVDNLSQVFWIDDVRTKQVVYLSPSYEAVWGQSVAQVYEHPEAFLESIHPEDRPRVEQRFLNVVEDRYSDQYRIVRPDGVIRWIMTRGFPVRDARGDVRYVYGLSEDITDQMVAQAALGQEHDLLRMMIDVLPDYIFIKNREGQFVLSNITHAAAAGIADPNALVGKRAHDVFPPQLAEQFDVDDQAVMESGEGLVNVERQSVDSAGNPRWVLTSKLPMRDSQGEVIGVVGISRDITARKQVESQRLDLALEREKVAMLQRFIDAASHDLRTPLTVIKSALDLLRKVDNPEKRQRYLAQLEQQTGRMEALLDEILQLAWLDRAEFEFDPEPQDINALIQAVIDEQTSLAVRKRHSLTFTPAPDLTPIRTNSTELRRAIRHLLINAMNYTPDGGIITVTTARQSNEILIHVADNGIGIRPEHQQQIFERFVRVDPARQTDTGGTGLGLPIVQRIIEAHGGTVTLESTIDVGSTFTIHLPIPT